MKHIYENKAYSYHCYYIRFSNAHRIQYVRMQRSGLKKSQFLICIQFKMFVGQFHATVQRAYNHCPHRKKESP